MFADPRCRFLKLDHKLAIRHFVLEDPLDYSLRENRFRALGSRKRIPKSTRNSLCRIFITPSDSPNGIRALVGHTERHPGGSPKPVSLATLGLYLATCLLALFGAGLILILLRLRHFD